MFIATWLAIGFCASGGADWEVGIFLIPHLSWGGPNWEFWAHTPIIKLTYLSHFAILVSYSFRHLGTSQTRSFFPKSASVKVSQASVKAPRYAYIKGQLATAGVLSQRRFDARFDKRRFLTSSGNRRRLKLASCQSVCQSASRKHSDSRQLASYVCILRCFDRRLRRFDRGAFLEKLLVCEVP